MLIATLLFSIRTVQSPKLPINFNPTNKQLGDYIIISEPSSVTLYTELGGDNHYVGSVQQAAAVPNAKYWTRVVCCCWWGRAQYRCWNSWCHLLKSMWNTTTEPVARPAIRNLGSRECLLTEEKNIVWKYKFLSWLLLLVVRERETPDAGVTGGEGVEQREVECPPDLSQNIVGILWHEEMW